MADFDPGDVLGVGYGKVPKFVARELCRDVGADDAPGVVGEDIQPL